MDGFNYKSSQAFRDNKSQVTKRELEVLLLISRGYKNYEIAEVLFITKGTVEQHKAHILKKLKLKTTNELTIFAVINQSKIKLMLEEHYCYTDDIEKKT